MTAPAAPGRGLAAAVRGLLAEAAEVHRDHPAAAARVRALQDRLDEPLRVALAGRVKAGKSTLLNALVGERIAPTDAGECTRVVTWYRQGPVPRVELHALDGSRRPLPVRRVRGELRLELAEAAAEQVERLVVDWPTAGLAAATLIDTPGISSLSVEASARTQAFLDAGDQLSGADAVVFLTRQFQPADLAFLAAVQRACGGLPTTTLSVLSRADDTGGGQLDALLTAEALARRTAELPAVRALCSTVLPVAGLMALGGRTLRHADFVAFRTLALADRAAVESVLLTADRFRRPEAPVDLPAEVRAGLAERFGLFGVRMAVALLRTGVTDAPTLAEELVARSGLAELQRLVAVQFTARGDQLKATTALRLLERLLREQPVPGDAVLWRGLDRVRSSSLELPELELLSRTRAPDGPFPADTREEAERLLGATDPSPAARLGLPPDASPEQLRAAAGRAVRRWQERAADPLARRAAVDAAELLVQEAEALLAALPADPGSAVGSPPAP
ncbi:Isoniazid-inductible GTPase (dynamin-related) [Modestobacter italicus]|uniref:Isoniazid-inductible GTPase (Dynamin-related) n=1 Tax=Modestobacter italicus (strain DSM 44449 / CECT 9708 / BC 501) TaxID=2732864 RepID=I4EQ58_MODI5|nr:dynamin family protein [Modestobacter marinus]CCH85521.1 Isoniazid-inductible GTPase (dynamin-related) [Modestobacter marinus]